MNSFFRTIAMTAGMALMVVTPAHAADLTINFTGSFARGTCAFSVPNVDLGTYAAPDFDTVPTTAWKTVRITRSSCTSDISMIRMAFAGTPHPDNRALWRVNSINGLAVQLQNMDAAPIQVNPGTTVVNWSAAWPSYELTARFSRVSAITSYGTVSVPVTLTFTYN